ncbi:MAG: hypothetical protein M1819_004629 [Sarea resinae]|nr:MAG: hypothetical protein M1819_004629 [Sarea resinae]
MSSVGSPNTEAYMRNLPSIDDQTGIFSFSSADTDSNLFESLSLHSLPSSTSEAPYAIGTKSQKSMPLARGDDLSRSFTSNPRVYGGHPSNFLTAPRYPPSYAVPIDNKNNNNDSSLSPASVNNQLSSTAGCPSEHSYSEISGHTTPFPDTTFMESNLALPYLEESFMQLGDFDNATFSDGAPSQSRRTSISNRNASDGLHTAASWSSSMGVSPQDLMSPYSRNDEFSYSGPNSALVDQGESDRTTAGPRNADPVQTRAQHLDLDSALALANNSRRNSVHTDNDRPTAHFISPSPIVRVESFSRGDSPRRNRTNRNSNRDGMSDHRSSNHLSPFPAGDSSEGESEDSGCDAALPEICVAAQAGRADDGSWLPNTATGQAGIEPELREQMNQIEMPTLKEQDADRKTAEKNAEVKEWLERSEAGSEAGEDLVQTGFLDPWRPEANRRRAKSTGDCDFTGDGSLDILGGPAYRFGYGEADVTDAEGASGDEQNDRSQSHEDNQTISRPGYVGPIDREHTRQTIPTVDKEPDLRQFYRAKFWDDAPPGPVRADTRAQPPTSIAAIVRFRQRAENIETASRAATWGTRRLSETDVDRLLRPPSVFKPFTFGKDKEKEREKGKDKTDRRESLFGKAATLLHHKRSNSNTKRKTSEPTQQTSCDPADKTRKESTGSVNLPKRIGSWGRPKSPKFSPTGLGPVAASGEGEESGPTSPSSSNAAPGPWGQAKSMMSRNRSSSNLRRTSSACEKGLAELMVQHGGPPMPTLASLPRDKDTPHARGPPQNGEDVDEDEDGEGLNDKDDTIDLSTSTEPIVPNTEGFKAHIRRINPALDPLLIDRMAGEQVKRYNRLKEILAKHAIAINTQTCSSGELCTHFDGWKLPLQRSLQANQSSFADPSNYTKRIDEEFDDSKEGIIVLSTQFPRGVPSPPVARLPARFECPICFVVKNIKKPSDWTKHVYEDVQPFTCTFADCTGPNSFKRKADWVRHENERHRHLEWWTCNVADCNHTCYRKDNFVQHLTREHQKPDTNLRLGKNGQPGAEMRRHQDSKSHAIPSEGTDLITKDNDRIWALVEECRHLTPMKPEEEPCRFCGRECSSWKTLTVHLAKHMEQISMPVLDLVRRNGSGNTAVVSRVDRSWQQQRPFPSATMAPGLEAAALNPPMPHQIMMMNSAIGDSSADSRDFPNYRSYPGHPSNGSTNAYNPPQAQSYIAQASGQASAGGHRHSMDPGTAAATFSSGISPSEEVSKYYGYPNQIANTQIRSNGVPTSTRANGDQSSSAVRPSPYFPQAVSTTNPQTQWGLAVPAQYGFCDDAGGYAAEAPRAPPQYYVQQQQNFPFYGQ